MSNNITDIFNKYKNKLLAYAKGQVGIEEDAEDIVQDVFLHLTLQDKATEIENVLSWLYTTARNSIIDFRRKAKEVEMPQIKINDDGDEFLLDVTEILADNDSSPEKEYIRSLVWEELQQALEELPDEQRYVFVATTLNDLSFKELAAKTGVPEKTLLSRKHYAVIHLRKRLKDIYELLLMEK